MKKADKNEIDVLERAKCREIVSEILNFGVNQTQIKALIKLLAMELEDREVMISIVNTLSNEIEVEEKPQITV